MAEVVNVNFKLDSDVKKKMESACADMGLSMSAAFTIFAKKFRKQYPPFRSHTPGHKEWQGTRC